VSQSPLIARLWEGSTRPADAEAYVNYLLGTGLADYARTPGNRGVLTLRRRTPERADFLLISLWESEAAIRAFAGDSPSTARFYPEDERFLIRRDEEVRHFDLVHHSGLTLP
jgi:heme-degrading monooxygenase HmoA